ncbi:hypothetical protein [Photobacterium sanguinicancri]|uniref:hypothetical protein n=1 Tax=Photobacterium sanguinicancri TaxID=875932 RepID=UPI003D0C4BA9
MRNEVELPNPDMSPEAEPYPANCKKVNSCELEGKLEEYKDIAYFVGSDSFYLLTEEACEKLGVAEDKLQELIDKDTNILISLSEADALDGLVKADLEAFIPFTKLKQYNRDKAWIKNAPNEAKKHKESYGSFAPREGFTYIYNEKKSFIEKCQFEAIDIAQKKGYIYDNGLLYSPRETEIKKLLKTYITAKANFLRDNTTSPTDQIVTLESEIKSLANFYANSNLSYHVEDAAKLAKLRKENELNSKVRSYKKLTDTIAELAFIGIATPELALSMDSKNIIGSLSDSDLTNTKEYGQNLIALYYGYESKEHEINTKIRTKLSELSRATNQYAIPPQAILDTEYETLKLIIKKKNKIKNHAQQAVASSKGTFFLVWDIDDYQSKPMQSLMQDNYPLREYLRAESAQSSETNIAQGLKYFSLIHLPQTKEDRNSGLYKSRQSPDEAFFRLLASDVKKIRILSSWFDEDGFFNADKVQEHFKNKNITIQSLNGDIENWRLTISKILYARKLKNRINPFNDSYQAQLVRLISKASRSEYLGKTLSIEHENTTTSNIAKISKINSNNGKSKYELGKFEAKTEFALRTGNISLFEATTGDKYFSLPQDDSINAQSTLDFAYRDSDGNKQICTYAIGALQAKFSCDAFGFAGVNLAVSQQLQLEDGSLSIPTLFKKEGNSGDERFSSDATSLKAEAKIGVELGCFILWHLPIHKNHEQQEWIPDYIVPSNVKMMTLIKAAVKVSVGKELQCPIYFSMKNKKLNVTVTIPVKLSQVEFTGEINGEALGAWVWMFQRILRKCNYHKVEIADDESFKQLSTLSRVMLYTTTNIGFFLAQKKDTWDKIVDLFDTDNAGNVAYAITYGNAPVLRAWIKSMNPEALGPLIKRLLATSENLKIKTEKSEFLILDSVEVRLLQQTALCKIFKWLSDNSSTSVIELRYTERQVEESFYLISDRIYPNIKQKKLLTFNENTDHIIKFLSKKTQFTDINNSDLYLQYKLESLHWQKNLDKITSRLYNETLKKEDTYNKQIKTELFRRSEIAKEYMGL